MIAEQQNPTIEEQKALLQLIKFTPRTYKIEIEGRGGEIVVGSVERATYDYLLSNYINIEELIEDADNDLEVPTDHLFILDGEWYDCDNLAHENGAEMTDISCIVVYDELSNEIWRHPLNIATLEESNIGVEEIAECYIENLPPGSAAFVGQSYEKGLFFGGEFLIKDEFDPTKIKIEYSDIEGWVIFSSIQYNGEYVDNEEYDTIDKGTMFDLQLIEHNS